METSDILHRFRNHKIGVLMGGLSSERDISIRSGDNVYNALKRLGLNTIKIDVTRQVSDDIKKEGVNLAFIALHGKYGEDGAVQGLLEIMDIPYTGSGVLGSSIGMNKQITKKILSDSGVPVPRSISLAGLTAEECLRQIEASIGFPAVFKPNAEGSSIGVFLIKDKADFLQKVPQYLKEFPDSFLEQYVHGREMTIGVIGRGENIQVLPILELKPKNEFYDFEAKYTKGMTEMEIPAKISREKQLLLTRYVEKAYRELYLSGVARFDVMLDESENPYFLEVNTIPGMTDTSDVPAMAKAAGLSFEDIVLQILESAEK